MTQRVRRGGAGWFLWALGLCLLLMIAALWWRWPGRNVASRRLQVVPRQALASTPWVALVEVGEALPPRWKAAVEAALQVYPLRARWLPRRSLPGAAWHRSFRRYRAGRLCRFLAGWRPPWAKWIIGVTTADISAKQLGFVDHAVFGLADVGGPAAMLSVHRLWQASLAREQRLSRARRLRAWQAVVIHEVGHLWGLPHCQVPSCPMSVAGASIKRLLSQQRRLCLRCRASLRD